MKCHVKERDFYSLLIPLDLSNNAEKVCKKLMIMLRPDWLCICVEMVAPYSLSLPVHTLDIAYFYCSGL